MLTRKTLSKFAILESLVQKFLPRRGMTASFHSHYSSNHSQSQAISVLQKQAHISVSA